MLLDHLGLDKAAASVEQAVSDDLAARGDGVRSTAQIGDDLQRLSPEPDSFIRPPTANGKVASRHVIDRAKADVAADAGCPAEAILASPGSAGTSPTTWSHRVDRGRGWHDAELVPYGRSSSTATMSCITARIFEGLKDTDVKTAPSRRFARMNADASSGRHAVGDAELPEELFLRQSKRWSTRTGVVPGYDETSSTCARSCSPPSRLGVKPASSYLFMLIASPAGAYFHGASTGIGVAVDRVRAGGSRGTASKCAGNYAASLIASAGALRGATRWSGSMR